MQKTANASCTPNAIRPPVTLPRQNYEESSQHPAEICSTPTNISHLRLLKLVTMCFDDDNFPTALFTEGRWWGPVDVGSYGGESVFLGDGVDILCEGGKATPGSQKVHIFRLIVLYIFSPLLRPQRG